MTGTAGAPVAERAWEQQSVWSQIANGLKRDLQRSRNVLLALTVVGALLSAAAVVAGLGSELGKGLAALGGAAVGIAAIARARAGGDAVQTWTRARSVAEAIKSEVYLYQARAGVYGKPRRERVLDERVETIERDAANLAPHKAGVKPARRALPPVIDAATYVRERIDVQIGDFYRPRAAELRRRIRRIRDAQLALSALGVAIAAVAAFTGSDAVAVWIPALTTIAGAVSAHAAAERYEYLLVEYVRTADELERLRDRRGSAAGLSDEELIRAAEQVISIQNEGWLAKLTTEPAPGPGP